MKRTVLLLCALMMLILAGCGQAVQPMPEASPEKPAGQSAAPEKTVVLSPEPTPEPTVEPNPAQWQPPWPTPDPSLTEAEKQELYDEGVSLYSFEGVDKGIAILERIWDYKDTLDFLAAMYQFANEEPPGLPLQYRLNTFLDDGSIGIEVYVNDELMDVRVFPDKKALNSSSPQNVMDYTQAAPIAEFLGITIEADEQSNTLVLSSDQYPTTDQYSFGGSAKIIDGELYVFFAVFRVHTEGSLRQDDADAMYLYTLDYARDDLPKTLEECYAMLDEELSDEDIAYMKNATEADMIDMHFGFGMWIRNNWLYPNQSELTELLWDAGIGHIDDMSGLILDGYVRYLNGEPSALEDLAEAHTYDYS